jgi:drug/metabolite transporter (DMT)-like permease
MSTIGARIPPLQSAFYRYLIQCCISFLSIGVARRDKLHLISTWCGPWQHFSKLFYRSCFGVMAVASWFSALHVLPVADATAINYVNIPLTSILASYVLKEPYRSFYYKV